tara:strand:+ start:1830 stop:2072 length:243 start_codon:yes stop_codon:yes gene_type:complete
MNQIINMIMRQVMGRLINKGVSIGFDQASKLGKGRKAGGNQDAAGPNVSAEENAGRDKTGRDQGKRARDMMKNMRRLNKF